MSPKGTCGVGAGQIDRPNSTQQSDAAAFLLVFIAVALQCPAGHDATDLLSELVPEVYGGLLCFAMPPRQWLEGTSDT